MPRNGSGTYSLPAGNPVVTGTTISSTTHNNTMSDLATAITQSIASTGVTTPSANLPMGGFKHTGLGAGSSAGDSVRYEQLAEAVTKTGDITMSGAMIIEAEGATVTAASSTNIWATDGNTVHIAGSTGINDFGTAPQAGAWMKVIFDGALTLTHSANLNLNAGGANITTAADDVAFVYADTTTQMDVFVFKKSGRANVEPASPGWTLLTTATASNSATVDFTANINSTYDEYIVSLLNVIPATDTDALWMRTSTNGGSSFDAGANDYPWVRNDTTTAGTSAAGSAAGQAQIVLASSVGSDTNETGCSFHIHLIRPSQAQYFDIYWVGGFISSAPAMTAVDGFARRATAADVDAIRFLCSSGNIESGEFKLYGLKKTV